MKFLPLIYQVNNVVVVELENNSPGWQCINGRIVVIIVSRIVAKREQNVSHHL
jgi:hypothetical protein